MTNTSPRSIIDALTRSPKRNRSKSNSCSSQLEEQASPRGRRPVQETNSNSTAASSASPASSSVFGESSSGAVVTTAPATYDASANTSIGGEVLMTAPGCPSSVEQDGDQKASSRGSLLRPPSGGSLDKMITGAAEVEAVDGYATLDDNDSEPGLPLHSEEPPVKPSEQADPMTVHTTSSTEDEDETSDESSVEDDQSNSSSNHIGMEEMIDSELPTTQCSAVPENEAVNDQRWGTGAHLNNSVMSVPEEQAVNDETVESRAVQTWGNNGGMSAMSSDSNPFGSGDSVSGGGRLKAAQQRWSREDVQRCDSSMSMDSNSVCGSVASAAAPMKPRRIASGDSNSLSRFVDPHGASDPLRARPERRSSFGTTNSTATSNSTPTLVMDNTEAGCALRKMKEQEEKPKDESRQASETLVYKEDGGPAATAPTLLELVDQESKKKSEAPPITKPSATAPTAPSGGAATKMIAKQPAHGGKKSKKRIKVSAAALGLTMHGDGKMDPKQLEEVKRRWKVEHAAAGGGDHPLSAVPSQKMPVKVSASQLGISLHSGDAKYDPKQLEQAIKKWTVDKRNDPKEPNHLTVASPGLLKPKATARERQPEHSSEPLPNLANRRRSKSRGRAASSGEGSSGNSIARHKSRGRGERDQRGERSKSRSRQRDGPEERGRSKSRSRARSVGRRESVESGSSGSKNHQRWEAGNKTNNASLNMALRRSTNEKSALEVRSVTPGMIEDQKRKRSQSVPRRGSLGERRMPDAESSSRPSTNKPSYPKSKTGAAGSLEEKRRRSQSVPRPRPERQASPTTDDDQRRCSQRSLSGNKGNAQAPRRSSQASHGSNDSMSEQRRRSQSTPRGGHREAGPDMTSSPRRGTTSPTRTGDNRRKISLRRSSSRDYDSSDTADSERRSSRPGPQRGRSRNEQIPIPQEESLEERRRRSKSAPRPRPEDAAPVSSGAPENAEDMFRKLREAGITPDQYKKLMELGVNMSAT